jgi:hypothetical protein
MEKCVLKAADRRLQYLEEDALDQVIGGASTGEYGRTIAQVWNNM